MKIYLSILLLALFLPQINYAQDSTLVVEPNFRISIEQKELFRTFEFDTIAVEISPTESPLKGFALKIATQTQFFHIDEIIPGDFYNDCGWEFFNSREIISDFSAENYLPVWQVIGLSELFADSIRPSCYKTDKKKPLAKIVISRNQFSQQPDSLVPLFFLWEDCSDNTISGMSGNDLYISKSVFQTFVNQPLFQQNKFPTTQGIPASCSKPSSLNAPKKAISFIHGGVILKEFVLEDSVISDK